MTEKTGIKKLFVGNLPTRFTTAELKALFVDFGNVIEAEVISSFGFIHYDSAESAQKAVEALHEKEVKGKKIKVEFSTKSNGPKKGTSADPCFSCNRFGHIARECPMKFGSGYGDDLCFACGIPGHLARDCPNKLGPPDACYSCGNQGHIARDCPSPKISGNLEGPIDEYFSDEQEQILIEVANRLRYFDQMGYPIDHPTIENMIHSKRNDFWSFMTPEQGEIYRRQMDCGPAASFGSSYIPPPPPSMSGFKKKRLGSKQRKKSKGVIKGKVMKAGPADTSAFASDLGIDYGLSSPAPGYTGGTSVGAAGFGQPGAQTFPGYATPADATGPFQPSKKEPSMKPTTPQSDQELVGRNLASLVGYGATQAAGVSSLMGSSGFVNTNYTSFE